MVGTYNLINEYSSDPDSDDLSTSPHAIIAVVRLDKPLTYSRKDKGSITLDASAGAKTRGKTLVIVEDCVQMRVSRSKASHLKQLQATIQAGSYNYIVEILPGDWVLAWLVHGKDHADDLRRRIADGKACNGFNDGLKFVGRVESFRKQMRRDRASGRKNSRFALAAASFTELDSNIFYDQNLSDGTLESHNIGQWLARVGVDIREILPHQIDGLQQDNVHLLIPTFVEIMVGRGVSPSIKDFSIPSLLASFTGGGPAAHVQEAPFAYLVPKEVGDLLGRSSREPSKAGGILAYADILEVLFGVQKYTHTSPDQASVFVPDIADHDPLTTNSHRYTGTPMLGCFLPQMPSFDNRPLWQILYQYLNPVINEMYSCLRVSTVDGSVVPSLVVRQIPFTTPVLAAKLEGTKTPYTGFMDLPRWVMPGVLVTDADLGRSNATRCNFVHVFGQDANSANLTVTEQLGQNAPIRDDIDIQRSGLHPLMTTIACRINQQTGSTPSEWMELIADHAIGSQWTLNGTIAGFGIQSPVCEGDNLEFDGLVYHIESVDDAFVVDQTSGRRSWSTMFTLSNGMDPNGDTDVAGDFPLYPGFDPDDLTTYDPGFSVEGSEKVSSTPITGVDDSNG